MTPAQTAAAFRRSLERPRSCVEHSHPYWPATGPITVCGKARTCEICGHVAAAPPALRVHVRRRHGREVVPGRTGPSLAPDIMKPGKLDDDKPQQEPQSQEEVEAAIERQLEQEQGQQQQQQHTEPAPAASSPKGLAAAKLSSSSRTPKKSKKKRKRLEQQKSGLGQQ